MAELTDDKLSALLLERKLASLQQINECLAIQSKMREMGIVAKSLREIVVEKGFLSAAQMEALAGAAPAAAATAAPAGAEETHPAPKTGKSAPIQIPGYDIINKIGQGGMGAVFKGKQISMDRLVAIKILPPRFARDPLFVDRFTREAKASAKLNHENVIQGIDVGEVKGLHYFVMEFVEGEPVSKRLKALGKLPEAEALGIACQMTKALDHAHKNRLVHRDIKPENIMVTGAGVAKLCDLGLAKDIHSDSSLTEAGTSVGTPHYIAPEQARGEKDVDIRVDLYALGASLYHMLTGVVPYDGPTATVVMTKHVTEELTPPIKKNPEISAGANAIVCKAMVKQRDQRYQTPAEMQEDIEAVLRGEPPLHAKVRGRPVAGAAKTSPSSAALRAVRASGRPAGPVATSPMLVVAVIGAAVIIGGAILVVAKRDPAVVAGGGNQSPPVNAVPPANTAVPANVAVPTNLPNVTPTGTESREAELALAAIAGEEAKALAELKDIAGVQFKYEDFLAKYKNTDIARKAEIQRNRFEEAVQTRAEEWVKEAEKKVQTAMDAGRYEEAVALEKEIPPALLPTNAVARLKESIGRARLAQDQANRDALAEAEAKAGKGDWDGAIAALRKIDAFGSLAMKRDAEARIRELQSKQRTAVASQAKDAEKLYREKFTPEIEAILFGKKVTRYPDALKRCSDLMNAELKPIADLVARDLLIDATLLAALRDDVLAGINALHVRGTAVRLDGIQDKSQVKFYPSATAGAWEYKSTAPSGAQMALNLDALSPADLALLAAESPAFKSGPTDAAMKLGLLDHYGTPTPESKKWFEKAAAGYAAEGNPERAERAKHYLDLADGLAAGSAKEKAVRDRYAKGEKAFKDKQWQEAKTQLAALLDPANPEGWSSMTFVKEKTAAIREMLRKCDVELVGKKGSKAYEGLFAVKPVEGADGKLTFDYTWADPAEVEDWTPVGGALGSNTKWIHNPRSGRVRLDDGNVQWKGKLTGDFTLEVEFQAAPGGMTRNFNVIFDNQGMQPGNSHFYFMGLATEKMFLEDVLAGLPGGGGQLLAMLRSTKPDRLIRIDSSRQMGGSPVAVLDSDKVANYAGKGRYSVKLERQGKNLKTTFEKTSVLQAQDDAMNSGGLSLGFFDSAGLIWRIRIVGTLDPEWLAGPH